MDREKGRCRSSCGSRMRAFAVLNLWGSIGGHSGNRSFGPGPAVPGLVLPLDLPFLRIRGFSGSSCQDLQGSVRVTLSSPSTTITADFVPSP